MLHLERAPDAHDRRATIIKFTEAGCRYLIDAYEIKREIESEYEALLGEDGMVTLRGWLKTLTDSK